MSYECLKCIMWHLTGVTTRPWFCTKIQGSTKIKILACRWAACTSVLLAWSYFKLAQSSVNNQMSQLTIFGHACLSGKWPVKLIKPAKYTSHNIIVFIELPPGLVSHVLSINSLTCQNRGKDRQSCCFSHLQIPGQTLPLMSCWKHWRLLGGMMLLNWLRSTERKVRGTSQ